MAHFYNNCYWEKLFFRMTSAQEQTDATAPAIQGNLINARFSFINFQYD